MAQKFVKRPKDYRRPYKQLPKEHSFPIEKRMSSLTPFRIQNIWDAQGAKEWFRASLVSKIISNRIEAAKEGRTRSESICEG